MYILTFPLLFRAHAIDWGTDMNEGAEQIRKYLRGFYRDEEMPALLEQTEQWAVTQPLAGLRVLDATPLFRNTLAKFMALLAGGAEVYVPTRSTMPHDPAIMRLVSEFGIRYARKDDPMYDIVLDCAGQFPRLKPALGAVELTRTGVARYEHAHTPVLVADGGTIKRVETILGTGDGFFRALRQLGYGDFAQRRLLIIGGGKVGQGVMHYARKEGMKVSVADIVNKAGELPGDVSFVDANDAEALNEAILNSWCTVTMTGRVGALRHKLHAADVTNSKVLLANLGVEDEFGSEIPRERVLNNKQPLNFVLEEPTSMRFIETTMALHNACALELLIADLPHKCLPPPTDVEEALLRTACEQGLIGEDVRRLGLC